MRHVPRILRGIILILAAIALSANSCLWDVDPPVKTTLIYDLTKSLNDNSCGGNACVSFVGTATYKLGSGNTQDFEFSFGTDSRVVLTISTTKLVFYGDSPTYVRFEEDDKQSRIVQWSV